jgi:hypothetical protein
VVKNLVLITAGAMLLGIGPARAGVIASSDFENAGDGVDGWTFVSDGSNLQRIASGGNPGGFLQVTDTAAGGTIYFVAPSEFLGNMSSAYNGTLTFDLQQSPAGSTFSNDDLILVGNSITLAFDTPSDPATTPAWTSYSVSLLASAGWKVGSISGVDATELQLQSVLADLTGISIRAEFNGSDPEVDGLDNVILNSPAAEGVPEPGTAGLAAGAAALLLWLKRR